MIDDLIRLNQLRMVFNKARLEKVTIMPWVLRLDVLWVKWPGQKWAAVITFVWNEFLTGR